jgi:hypothetical protein
MVKASKPDILAIVTFLAYSTGKMGEGQGDGSGDGEMKDNVGHSSNSQTLQCIISRRKAANRPH